MSIELINTNKYNKLLMIKMQLYKNILKKRYGCSKWDYDNNKYFNVSNYGKIIDIDELYVCFQRISIIKKRHILYHEEIKFIFLKIYNSPIRKKYI